MARKVAFVAFWLLVTVLAVWHLIRHAAAYVDMPRFRSLGQGVAQPLVSHEGAIRSSWRDARKRPSFGVDVFGNKKES